MDYKRFLKVKYKINGLKSIRRKRRYKALHKKLRDLKKKQLGLKPVLK